MKWPCLLVVTAAFVHSCNGACNAVSMSDGTVCQCSDVDCPTDVEPLNLSDDIAVVYTSSLAGDRLSRGTANFSMSTSTSAERILLRSLSSSSPREINLNADEEYQTLDGFGGAFTDASAGLVYNMTKDTQENLAKSYFSPDGGLGYSMGRTHMGSCDFSRQSYSLDNNVSYVMDDRLIPGQDYKINLMQLAQNYSQALKIFVSVWSAPVRWKTCSSPPAPAWYEMNSCSAFWSDKKPTYEKGALDSSSDTRTAYANYYTDFIKQYKTNHNLNIFGITTQNEPAGNPLGNKWENTYYTPDDQLSFIEEYLGPTLKGAFPDMKIMIGDDQLPEVDTYSSLFNQSNYVDGVAYHWYKSMNAVLQDTKANIFGLGGGKQVRDSAVKYDMVNRDGKGFLLPTEACNGYMDNTVKPGSWSRGYNYVRDIIHQLNNFATGWVDWNLVLDTDGGPNHAGNMVDAPVIAQNSTHFYKNPMFYAMGHFSAFLEPGSVRIGVENLENSYISKADLEIAAFKTPSNKIVVVIANDRQPTSVWQIFATPKIRPRLASETVQINYKGKTVELVVGKNEWKTVVFNA